MGSRTFIRYQRLNHHNPEHQHRHPKAQRDLDPLPWNQHPGIVGGPRTLVCRAARALGGVALSQGRARGRGLLISAHARVSECVGGETGSWRDGSIPGRAEPSSASPTLNRPSVRVSRGFKNCFARACVRVLEVPTVRKR